VSSLLANQCTECIYNYIYYYDHFSCNLPDFLELRFSRITPG